jgi:hypothetical protein
LSLACFVQGRHGLLLVDVLRPQRLLEVGSYSLIGSKAAPRAVSRQLRRLVRGTVTRRLAARPLGPDQGERAQQRGCRKGLSFHGLISGLMRENHPGPGTDSAPIPVSLPGSRETYARLEDPSCTSRRSCAISPPGDGGPGGGDVAGIWYQGLMTSPVYSPEREVRRR